MTNHLFSIVTISFNQAEYLERAIRSVLDQDYPSVEYIVVDPGSTDGSREIIEKYRGQISRIIFEPDNGPADGLNKGFSLATGDILGYINSDDAYLPGAFRKIGELFDSRPDLDVVFGHGYQIDRRGRTLYCLYSDQFTPWSFIHGSSVVVQQSTFFKRSAFETVGGFNVENRISWDGELILDFSLAKMKMKVMNDFLSTFTLHENSITAQLGQNSLKVKELELENQLMNVRMYRKVMGDFPGRWFFLFYIIARVVKWGRHPVRGLSRLFEKMMRVNRTPFRIG